MGVREVENEYGFAAWLTDIEKVYFSSGNNNEPTKHDLINNLFSKLNEVENDSDKASCLELLERIYKIEENDDSFWLALSMSFGLLSVGYHAYENNSFHLAECVFRLLSLMGDSNGKNNYAYMIRRDEVFDPSKHNYSEAALLLREGVVNREAFSMVNMALLFALHLNKEDDWKIADELISLISPSNAGSICSWWQGVAESGDAEGLLVHLWLLRHKKIESSVLGPRMELANRLSVKISRFPNWMKLYAGT